MKKNLFRILTSVFVIATCFVFTGCEESIDTEILPLVVLDQTVTETEIDVTVTKLIETTGTEKISSGGNGMVYNPSSGSWSYAFGVGGTQTVAVAKYYAILTDNNGKSYRFEFEGQDYSLLSEGQKITVKQVKYDPPSSLLSTEFYWGDSKIQFDADVTKILAESEDVNNGV